MFTKYHSPATNDYSPFTHPLIHASTHLPIYPFTHLRIDSLVNRIEQSMQNKPNFPKNRAIVCSCKAEGYENEPPFLAQKSQSQFAGCSDEHNFLYTNAIRTTRYAIRTKKQTQFKPNSNPNEPEFFRNLAIVRYGIAGDYKTNLDFWLKNPKSKLVLSLSNGAKQFFSFIYVVKMLLFLL